MDADIKQVMARLPHRFPFLLIDRVDAWESEQSVTVTKNVTISEPCFQGHLPDYPIYPGVLILESMAQTMVFLMGPKEDNCTEPDSMYFFTGIDKARFRSQVFPGDVLTITTNLLRRTQDVAKFVSTAYVGDKLVCSATLMGTLKEVKK